MSVQAISLNGDEQQAIGTAKVVAPVEPSQRYRDEISVLKTRILELEQTADTDPLVPVYNRRALMREIGRAQTLMARYDILCSIIFFDLNGFKEINDRYGHNIGDDLLIKVGTILS
ncbi:MAG: diguanylate cyclase, partial [Devosiaceae bacterium]|nr:diguanylate cyclase [Devosiaceae bacterium]